ncbi:MAG: murein biosynthesis integral membrane protein MurJ [Thermoleophilia bacterium]|nr:murein biosynthesis integral membrane protein MurJ [Thermoleophilia bacterium]
MSSLPSAPGDEAAAGATPTSPPTRPAGARRSTVVVMIATLLTKVVGLGREVVVAAIYGAGSTFSAFTVAFQIPNVIRTFVADQALVSSLVPVFTGLREDGDERRAWHVASTVVSVLLILLLPLTALAMWGADFLVDIAVYDRNDQIDMVLAAQLFRIMIPVVVLMSIGGVIIGILQSYGKFGAPAFAQLSFNAVAVIVLLAAQPDKSQIAVYAWAILIATVVQALLPAPWLRGHGQRLSLGGAFGDPAVRAVVVAMLPVMLALATLNLNNIVNTYWSSRLTTDQLLGDGGAGPATIFKAFGVFQLPQGIFSLAVATVFFPMFARFAARRDDDGFRDSVVASCRQIVVLLMPASIFMVVLAEPIVQLLFQRGEFGADNTQLVAWALQGFAVGLIGNGAIQLLMRAFFSLRTPWTPAIIGFFVNLLGNIVLGGLLHGPMGVRGITLSMAIANTLSFVVMYAILRRRLDGAPVGPIVSALVISGLAAGGSVAVGWLGWDAVQAAMGDGLAGQAVSMCVAIALTWGIYGALALRLRLVNVPQLRRALNRRR